MSESGTTMEQPAVGSSDPAPRRRWAPWMQLAAIALSFAVIGFVAGWVLRGEDGAVSELPSAATDATTTDANQGTTTDEPTSTTQAEPTLAPRADVGLVVLNGGTVNGLAGSTAEQAEGLGYTDVVADNAPTQNGPTVVFYTPSNQPAAERAATDLEFGPVEALPETGELAVATSTAAPDGADVVVVLGTT